MANTPFRTVIVRFLFVALLAIGLAYIEAAVVVYLRAIFYPHGFTFPLAPFDTDPLWRKFLLVEVGREAATLVVLFTAAWLIGHDTRSRGANFLTLFAIWDIFYYVWLMLLLHWPASLMDWDILFLIPVTWAGPVFAPLVVSLAMLVFAVIILYRQQRAKPLCLTRLSSLGLALAAFLIIAAFCHAGRYVCRPDFASHFHWPLFLAGAIIALLLFLRCALRRR